MDDCNMIFVIQADSPRALTVCCTTHWTSLTYISLIYFISNIAFTLLPNSHLEIEIECVGHFSPSFFFYNFHMTHLTLPHAHTDYHISQFGH